MPARGFVVAYWAWLAALALLFVAVPRSQAAVVALAGLTACAAISYGVRTHGPARRWPWYCLAVAVLLSAAGQVVSRVLPGPAATYRPGSLALYGIVAAMSVAMVAGIVGLARAAPRDASAVLDVAILLLGTGLLAGVLVAVPYALTPDLPTVQAAARVFFVARDVVLLAATVHFATSARWTGATALIVGGAVAFLAYDASYRLGLIRGVVLQGTLVELSWLLFVATWGMAALLPTMRRLGERGVLVPRPLSLRLVLLAVAAVLPVALLTLATFQRARPGHEPVLAAGSVAMLGLVLAQLLRTAVVLRNQVAGERAMSRAVARLAAANTREDVVAAIETSVPLLSSGRASRHVLAAVDTEPGEAAATPGAPETGEVVTQPPAGVARRLGPGPALAVPLVSGHPDDRWILYLRGDPGALRRARSRIDVLTTQARLVLERIRLNAELVRRTTEEYINALAQASGDIILLVDDRDAVTMASRTAGPVFDSATLVGSRLPELVDDEARGPVTDLLRRARARPAPAEDRAGAPAGSRGPAEPVAPPASVTVEPANVDTVHWSMHREDGTQVEFEVACRRVTSTEPSVRGVLVDLRDVTEQRRLERELTERASRDTLTGLVSGAQIRAWVRNHIEARPEALIGMIVLDLNDFKLVNNRYGPDVGDMVLRTVADRLATALPGDGLAGRVAGDRFAVVAGVASPRQADELAAQLLATVALPVPVDDDAVTCTASAGVATTADASTARELTRQAELALLIAQDEGRGRWHHYDPTVRSIVLERLEIRAALEHALDENLLALEYQPIVKLDSGVVAGFEALLRWRHPTFHALKPETVMDVAEESKLSIPIGEWALATATRDASRWNTTAQHPVVYVAVNVTSTHLASPGFSARVRDKLADAGLPASRLHIEITESTLVSEAAGWAELQQLRDAGVQVAIDDFGTGYSALSYLGRVPADQIKLDRQFVGSMAVSRTQRELVSGIVKLARTLDLEVVAEGIETAQHRDLAAEAGCGFGQGYLFARPMPAAEVAQWLAGERDRLREGAAAAPRG